MNWIELTVLTTTEGAEVVSEQLIEAGSAGTMIEDRQDVHDYASSRVEGRWDILDENILKNMSEDVRVTGYYPRDFCAPDVLADVRGRLDELKRRAPERDWGKLALVTGDVDDEDWAENWKKSFVPFRLGARMVVKPSWCDYPRHEGDRVIEMDPGMAFGTGTHETTGLCVELLEQYLKPGDSVIDVGTGTGILAIAAALCGARDVLAIDIDPLAVRVAGENVLINHQAPVIRVRQGDLLEAVDEVADVVVANIIADVVAMLAQPVRAHIKDGGLFICSGIARAKKQGVLSALDEAGYREKDIREKGEWCAICAHK